MAFDLSAGSMIRSEHLPLDLVHEPSVTISRSDQFRSNLEIILNSRLRDKDFQVAELAKALHLSVSQLNRRLKSLGLPAAGRLLRVTKLQRAAEMIRRDVAAIGQIADRLGYKDQSHFCRSFKEHFGCPPTQYQRR